MKKHSPFSPLPKPQESHPPECWLFWITGSHETSLFVAYQSVLVSTNWDVNHNANGTTITYFSVLGKATRESPRKKQYQILVAQTCLVSKSSLRGVKIRPCIPTLCILSKAACHRAPCASPYLPLCGTNANRIKFTAHLLLSKEQFTRILPSAVNLHFPTWPKVQPPHGFHLQCPSSAQN